MVSQLLYCIRK